MTVVRDASRDVLDIARYAMKPQTYDLTLGNLGGKGATVTAWDPITDKVLPVQVLDASATSLTVRVVAADYPCFLDITEASPGPLLAGVRVEQLKDRADLVFTGNRAGTATIEWGPYPQRRPAGLTGAWKPGFVLGEYFAGTDLQNLRSRRMDAKLELDWKGPGFENWPCVNVSVRWSGRIRVPTTGTYTFTSASDDGQRLWVAGRQLVDDWNGHGVQDKSGSIDLEAGKMVDLRWEYFQGAGGAEARLTWTPPGEPRQAIPAAVILPPSDLNPFDRSKPLEVVVVAGKETRVPLPGASAVDGVQISFAAAGLACRWPQWTYDVRGVLGFSAPVAADVAARGQLPALPEGTKAVAYTAGTGWTGNAPRQTAVLPGGGEAVLEWIAGDPWSALPVASTVDRRDSQVEVWNGMHSWTIDDRLEAVAHPGEKLLARRIRCVPVRDGVLLFTVRCADAAALQKAGPEIAALASTVAFTR